MRGSSQSFGRRVGVRLLSLPRLWIICRVPLCSVGLLCGKVEAVFPLWAAGGSEAALDMTLEELLPADNAAERMRSVGEALERLLVAAQRQGCLTVGVYEAAKLMNADPDSVVLCLLAADEADIALQIHFTLIQAFCCANEIHILRASGLERLAAVLGESPPDGGGGAEPRDLHCLLVTTRHTDSWGSQGLAEVATFCQESRCNDQWVPYVALQAR